MRRVGTVGILLVAISSFLALQAMCRPFFLCIERSCEMGGRVSTSMEACVAPEPTGACLGAGGNGCAPHECGAGVSTPGPCGMDEVDDMDCSGRDGLREGPRASMPKVDFASTKTCCDSKGLPAQSGKCPRRAMSCIDCIPARFIWEPAPLNAVRHSNGAHQPALLATIAMIEADRAGRLAHAHAPPGNRPAEAGFDRRIAICSFLL